jgi:cobaltochelatase CobS
MFSEAAYPAKESEVALLKKSAPGLHESLCGSLVDIANKVRTLYDDGALDITLSTRSLIRWAKLTWAFESLPGVQKPVVYAMNRAFGFQTDPDSRSTLEELMQRIIAGEEA